MKKEDVADIVEDLIRIARVAMPSDLFEIDPRIRKAQALLVGLGRPSVRARTPNTGLDEIEAIMGPIIDLRPPKTFETMLDLDLIDGLFRAREHGLPPDDTNTLNFIIRDWLVAHGYLKPQPDTSN